MDVNEIFYVAALMVVLDSLGYWQLGEDNAIKSFTVNSGIFAMVLFSRNFALPAKFRENKILTNWRNHSVAY